MNRRKESQEGEKSEWEGDDHESNISNVIDHQCYRHCGDPGVGICVDTFEGNVTLPEAVDNETQRARATAIAKSVYGVGKVNNLIMINK